jgi:hypothetical protein
MSRIGIIGSFRVPPVKTDLVWFAIAFSIGRAALPRMQPAEYASGDCNACAPIRPHTLW